MVHHEGGRGGHAVAVGSEGGSAALGRGNGTRASEPTLRRVSPAAPGGRLRRKVGGRGEALHVRLSESEWAWVRTHAAEVGLSAQRYLIEAATGGGHERLVAQRALLGELMAARRDLAGACRNLNQLTRLAHVTGGRPARLGELASRLEGLAKLLESLAPVASRSLTVATAGPSRSDDGDGSGVRE